VSTQPTNPTQADTRRTRVACAIILLAPLAYSLQLTSFLYAKDIAYAAGLLLLACLPGRARPYPWNNVLQCSLAVVTLLIAAFALLHAVHPALFLPKLLRCLYLLLFITLLAEDLTDKARRKLLLDALLASTVLVALLGILQYHRLLPYFFPEFPHYTQPIYSVFGNQDLFGGYVAIGLILTLHAWREGRGATKLHTPLIVALLLLLGYALLLSGARSALLAVLLGALALLAARPRFTKRDAALGAISLVCIASAVVLLDPSPFSRIANTFTESDVGGRARLWMWDGTLRIFAAHPWTGVGPGAYALHTPKFLGEALHAPAGATHYRNELHADHAHSDPLEFAAEFGLLGIATLALLFFVALRRMHPDPVALALVTTLLTFAAINPMLRSTPHALVLVLSIAALFPAREDHRPGRAIPRFLMPVLAAAVLAVTAACIVYPSYTHARAQSLHLQRKDARAAYDRATSSIFASGQALEDAALAAHEQGNNDLALKLLQRARSQRDTGSYHLLRALVLESTGDFDAARTAYDACLFRWPDNTLARARRDALPDRKR